MVQSDLLRESTITAKKRGPPIGAMYLSRGALLCSRRYLPGVVTLPVYWFFWRILSPIVAGLFSVLFISFMGLLQS